MYLHFHLIVKSDRALVEFVPPGPCPGRRSSVRGFSRRIHSFCNCSSPSSSWIVSSSRNEAFWSSNSSLAFPVRPSLASSRHLIRLPRFEGNEKYLYHYTTAEMDKKVFKIGDCVHVNATGGSIYVAKILEFFELKDKSKWFRCQ